jgi:uncharacterized protein (TIGR02246 family)
MSPDEDGIVAVHTAWIEAVNAGDLAGLLTLMADDAVFLNPGQAPFGREGFSPNFLGAVERFQFKCSSELEEVVVVGEAAYTRSRDTLSLSPRSGGDVMLLAGYRLTVYRQQPDGRWLLARDAHTLSPVEQ